MQRRSHLFIDHVHLVGHALAHRANIGVVDESQNMHPFMQNQTGKKPLSPLIFPRLPKTVSKALVDQITKTILITNRSVPTMPATQELN